MRSACVQTNYIKRDYFSVFIYSPRHLMKNSELSWIKLVMCYKKGLNSISINWLNFPVGHLGLPTIGLSFRLFGSDISMILLFGVTATGFEPTTTIEDCSRFFNVRFMNFR